MFLRYTVILVLVILVTISLYIIFSDKVEYFSNTPMLSFVFETSPKMLSIYNDDFNNSEKMQTIVQKKPHIQFIKGQSYPSGCNDCLSMTDIFTYSILYEQASNKDDVKLFTIIPEDKVFLLAMNAARRNVRSNELKYFDKSTYGYFNDIEIEILKIIFRASNISYDETKFIKLDYSGTITTNLWESCDIIIIFNNMSFLRVEDGLRMEFIDYSEMDINVLKVYIPFVQRKPVVLSDYFNRNERIFDIRDLCCFDMVLYGNKGMEESKDYVYELSAINVLLDAFDKINYYTLYFPFFQQTMEYVRDKNAYIAKRGSMTILEQFEDDKKETNGSPALVFDKEIQGFYRASDQSIEIASKVNGIPLEMEDKVTLLGQEREEENGVYIVTKVRGNKAFMFKEEQKDTVNDKWEKYGCFNNPIARREEDCEKGMWDRPCETNSECPFYQINKNYKNYRGGCFNGYCEMPIGVKRLAYRTFDDTTKSMCYGCGPDEDNEACCTKSVSPDYAYPLDMYDRLV